MIKIVFIISLLFFQTCEENKTESLSKDQKAIPESLARETSLSQNIPALNFEALEPFLKKENDTLYVVNFWATWCKPCIKELPAFEKINSEYKSQKVKVLMVSLDFPEHMEKQLIPFIEKRQIKSEVLLLDDPDANTWIPKVSKAWTGAIPATLMYKNKERVFFERSFTFKELENEITSILKK